MNSVAKPENESGILNRLFGSSSLKRLRIALIVFEKELEPLKNKASNPSQLTINVDWRSSTDGLLKEAKQAAIDKNTEKGWRCLKAADRFMHFGLAEHAPELLYAKEKSYLIEAKDEKKGLSKWRKDSIIELLEPKQDKPKIEAESGGTSVVVQYHKTNLEHVYRIVEAKKLLDEHFDNVYQKQSIIKNRLFWLSVFGLIAIVLWFLLLLPIPIFINNENDPFGKFFADSPIKFWLAIVLAGVVGSILSSFTSTIGNEKGSSIPTELSSNVLAFSRLMVGALSAIVITVFLTADILSFQPENYAFILTIAIISGFSDRLLLSAIEKMVKK
jgi:phage pi2 protein 07